MPIRYVNAQLRNPQDPTAPQKHYLIAKTVGNIDRNYLIKEMVRNTSLTPMEAMTAIDYLFNAIPRLLELGFTVQLGEMGYFMVIIKSEGSDTADKATPDKIRNMRLKFVPGANIREQVNWRETRTHISKQTDALQETQLLTEIEQQTVIHQKEETEQNIKQQKKEKTESFEIKPGIKWLLIIALFLIAFLWLRYM